MAVLNYRVTDLQSIGFELRSSAAAERSWSPARPNSQTLKLSNSMKELSFPFTEEKIRALKVGDEVAITGTLFTGRDAVDKYLHDGGRLPSGVNLRNGILYHCGPVVIKDAQGQWNCTRSE